MCINNVIEIQSHGTAFSARSPFTVHRTWQMIFFFLIKQAIVVQSMQTIYLFIIFVEYE